MGTLSLQLIIGAVSGYVISNSIDEDFGTILKAFSTIALMVGIWMRAMLTFAR